MKLLLSLCFVLSLYGQVIDKIDIIVNNIPITSYDILQTQKQFNVDRNQAINYLIDQTILKSAIKQKGIYVDDFDIDNAMKKIAQKNGMSLFNFKTYLLQKGNLDKLKSQLKKKLEMDKLLASLNIRVTLEDVKKYYNIHQNEFKLPSKIEVTAYSSSQKELLVKVLNNPMLQNPNIEIKDMVLESTKTNPKLMMFVSKTNIDNFTPIINMGKNFVSFYVIKKDNFQKLPLKAVENEIYQTLVQEKQKMATKDFIAKSKAKADIQILAK